MDEDSFALLPQSSSHDAQRWWLLFISVCFAIVSNYQNTQYSIIDDIIQSYFGVKEWAVMCTVTVFMALYVPLIYHSMKLIEKKGLRCMMVFATGITMIGSWIKFATVEPDLFWFSCFGQTLVAVAQVTVYSIPSCLATQWFPPEEVSLATAIGIFGVSVGSAIGYVLPPLFCAQQDTEEQMRSGIFLMFFSNGIASTIVFLVTLACFKDKPHSVHQEEITLCKLLRRLCRNKNYMLLMAAYTLNQAVYNVVSSVLTTLLKNYFKDDDTFYGNVGLVTVIASMFGTLGLGWLANKYHKFRTLSFGAYSFCFVAMLTFTVASIFEIKVFVYITATIFGLFFGGYTYLGLDFAIELTYPEPESYTTGFLVTPGQVAGVICTLVFAKVLGNRPLIINIVNCVLVLIGVFLQVFVRSDLRRQAAINRMRLSEDVNHGEDARIDTQNEVSEGSTFKEKITEEMNDRHEENGETNGQPHIV